MQKREVTKKQLAVIILLSIGMLAAAALLNQFFPAGSKQTKETLKQTAVTPKVTALPSLSPVCAAWQIFIRHFLRMKVRRLTCTGMQKK